jgi:hypothetical protein
MALWGKLMKFKKLLPLFPYPFWGGRNPGKMGELGGFTAQLTHFSGFIPPSRQREGG